MDEVKRRLRDEVADLRQEIKQLRTDLAVRHCYCHHVPLPQVWLNCHICGQLYTGWHTCYPTVYTSAAQPGGITYTINGELAGGKETAG